MNKHAKSLFLIILMICCLSACMLQQETSYPDLTIPFDIEREWYDKLTAGYESLPEEVRAKMHSAHIEVRVVDDNDKELTSIREEYGSLNMMACYMPPALDENKQFVATHIIVSTSCANPARALVHEVGHLISDIHTDEHEYKATLYEDDFLMLYDKYFDLLKEFDASTKLNVYSPDEFFAELFRVYVEKPKWMAANMPEVITFMEEAIHTFTLS